jgi:hypothetical protein
MKASNSAPEHLLERMADAIGGLIGERGYCHIRDLEARGFTREEIGHCWASANGLAAALAPGMETDE